MSDEKWSPNYTEVVKSRQRYCLNIDRNPNLLLGAISYYRTHPVEFINDWCMTYDPRNSGEGKAALIPFVLFDRQKDFILFILSCLEDGESGLVEKSRDMGATWICCCLSVWLWLFKPGISIGWGSRKENLVDRIGDPDSIFEKLRMCIRYLPRFFWPPKFDPKRNISYMKIINPDGGATITGDAGSNIGRGGRKAIYFVDEAAHLEHPELIEAALSHNTNTQIDISSVNGAANVFARKRQSGDVWSPGTKITQGRTRVFIFDWRDHPAKNQEWYDIKRAKAEREGLLHIFAQEVDRDYLSAVDRIVIPAKYVTAAIDAHKKLGIKIEGEKVAGLDVADEGGDKNSVTLRYGILCTENKAWGEGDTGDTALKTVQLMRSNGITEMQYDCIGVGAGIKASINILKKREKYIKKISPVKWNAGANPLFGESRLIKGDRDTPKNKDFYLNLKAQAWWQARIRFEKTYNAVTKNISYPSDELISIDSTIEDLHELTNELSQATYITNNAGKIKINKNPSGTRSPNRADSFVMAFWPVKAKKVMI